MDYKFKILKLEDKEEWKLLVKKIGDDIYFLPQYSEIYSSHYSKEIDKVFHGEPIFFFYGSDDEYIVQSFLKRRINDQPFLKDFEEEYFDLISPYGYCGPLVKEPNKELVKGYLKTTTEYCLRNNIITEFVRFHPLIKNHGLFKQHHPLDARNITVSIDLTQEVSTIFQNMNKKTRNLIRKAEKNDIKIVCSENNDYFDDFVRLYLKTMSKNEAKKEYFLTNEYFENTRKLLCDNLTLFIAKYQEKIIAASLFMHKGKYIHYHFSGSDKEYLHLAPNNLLLFEVIKWAKYKGYEELHLGGGNSSDPKDPLFHFKSGFSDKTNQFYTMNRIHNPKIYKALVNMKKQAGEEINSNFFPAYRS